MVVFIIRHKKINPISSQQQKRKWKKNEIILTFFFFLANCVVMALDEHLPNGDKTLLALQLVSSNKDLMQYKFFFHKTVSFSKMSFIDISAALANNSQPDALNSGLYCDNSRPLYGHAADIYKYHLNILGITLLQLLHLIPAF